MSEGRKTVMLRRKEIEQQTAQEKARIEQMIRGNHQIIQQHDDRIRQMERALEDYKELDATLPVMHEGNLHAQGFTLTMRLEDDEDRKRFAGIIAVRRGKLEGMLTEEKRKRGLVIEANTSLEKSLAKETSAALK